MHILLFLEPLYYRAMLESCLEAFPLGGAAGQMDGEGGPAGGQVGRFDAAAVAVDNGLRQRQAEADAGHVARAGRGATVETVEQMRQVVDADAGPAVGDAQADTVAVLFVIDAD